MKRAAIACILVFCLLLSGCNTLLTGEYIWEQTHFIPPVPDSSQEIEASNYTQLVAVLSEYIEKGTDQLSISVARYDRNTLETDVERAVNEVRSSNPVAAYAVSNIIWQVGTSAGETVLLIQVNFRHDSFEIQNIKTVANNTEALSAIAEAMRNCDSGVVLRIESYETQDFMLAVEAYALNAPQYVMESPLIRVSVYPDSGSNRVVQIRFIYANGRDTLRDMQDQVLKVFDSSVNIVSLIESPREKYNQLYSFVVDRFRKYTIETSITPAYSLLLHGVGDSHAFAAVFAAMCREAGLHCQVVGGMKNGNLWYWNIVQIDGTYYHVDLLRSKGEGSLRFLTDTIINEGYVWDFDAYPACGEKPQA